METKKNKQFITIDLPKQGIKSITTHKDNPNTFIEWQNHIYNYGKNKWK